MMGVLFSEEYERPDWDQIIELVAKKELYKMVMSVVDGSSPEAIVEIKKLIGVATIFNFYLRCRTQTRLWYLSWE